MNVVSPILIETMVAYDRREGKRPLLCFFLGLSQIQLSIVLDSTTLLS